MLNQFTRNFSLSERSKEKQFILPQFVKKLNIQGNPIKSKNTFPRYNTIKALPNISLTSISLSKTLKLPKESPKVSAGSWLVFNCATEQLLASHNESERREVASLTKIMTCIICLEEGFKRGISLEDLIAVSKDASEMEGTSANLQENDKLKIIDLLYGLMLPSGNDAALALAEFFGKYTHGDPVSNFVFLMNQKAKDLGMKQTFFSNPHGLSISINLSTSSDICKLTVYCLKNPVFSKIVKKKHYSCSVQNSKNRALTWHNTNELLSKSFLGVKTGYTLSAGPCLSCYKDDIVIVLLNCRYKHSRWTDATQLLKWAKSI